MRLTTLARSKLLPRTSSASTLFVAARAELGGAHAANAVYSRFNHSVRFYFELPLPGAQRAQIPSLSLSDHTLRTLEQEYEVAYEAYQSCVNAGGRCGPERRKPSADCWITKQKL